MLARVAAAHKLAALFLPEVRYRQSALRLFVVIALVACFGCSETIDLLRVAGSDAGAGCQPGNAQCNDCEDNDNDGRIDGFDPECISAIDDDEGSFGTGIPGDNNNNSRQDCFLDGNSGSGDDGCDIHTCCILDLQGNMCPAEFSPGQFDPEACEPSAMCIEECLPLVPPGCDCFGCCTVCDGADCYDIAISPAISPDCDETTLDDPEACRRCIKSESCSADCDPANCILCPGQDPDDLPPGCELSCPNDLTPCLGTEDCATGEFCATGCCIAIPE
jgi:hypothetical protein